MLVQERRQRTRPQVCDPFAALRGKPVAGRLRGVPQNSLRATRSVQTTAANQSTQACALRRACSPRKRSTPGAVTGGEQPDTGHRCARPGAARREAPAPLGAERSDGPYHGCPSGRAEHRRLPRSAAKGTRTVGSSFFGLPFFDEAKKGRCAAGRISRPANIKKKSYSRNTSKRWRPKLQQPAKAAPRSAPAPRPITRRQTGRAGRLRTP